MKRYRILLSALFLISVVALRAEDTTLLTQAREAYTSGQYAQAAALYEQLAAQGQSPELYYNLGNTYYKLSQPARAILNYERALALRPSYDDATYNLALANAQIKDKIEPIELFFLVRWTRALRSSLTSNAWAYISISLFTLTLILLLLYVFSRYRWLRQTSFYLSIVALIFSITSFVFSYQQKSLAIHHPSAIVMEGSVTVKSSPDESGTQLFVIHEGTKVSIRSTLGAWAEVSIADGNIGWIKLSDIEQI